MRSTFSGLAIAALVAEVVHAAPQYTGHTGLQPQDPKQDYYISLGPRPFYLVNNMTASPLKTKLQSCENGPFQITDFSIGHRGITFLSLFIQLANIIKVAQRSRSLRRA
jgi:glycerophosphoryl diester phosphodiesterase